MAAHIKNNFYHIILHSTLILKIHFFILKFFFLIRVYLFSFVTSWSKFSHISFIFYFPINRILRYSPFEVGIKMSVLQNLLIFFFASVPEIRESERNVYFIHSCPVILDTLLINEEISVASEDLYWFLIFCYYSYIILCSILIERYRAQHT